MSRFRQYTDRVTLQSDGCYCWRQDTERKYELSRLKTGFTACAIIAVFILAFGVFLSIFNGTFNGTPINYTLNDIPASIYVFVLCAAVFMLISILVFGLSTLLVDSPGEIYTMSDTFIQTGEGQSSEYFYFKKAKKVPKAYDSFVATLELACLAQVQQFLRHLEKGEKNGEVSE